MSHLLLSGTVSGDVKLALCHEKEDYTYEGPSALGMWGGHFPFAVLGTSLYLCLREGAPCILLLRHPKACEKKLSF